jgi:RNA polymerase sigma factor (sigma-70 family)
MAAEAGLSAMRGLHEGLGPEPASAIEPWRRQRLEAFAAFDDARLLRSYRLAALILRDRDEAEDATQEAIARAWSRWDSLRDISRFDSWFDQILVNVCRNRLRHARTVRMVALDESADQTAPAWDCTTVVRLALEQAFAELSPEQRILVVLRYWRDLPVEQIADRLGIATGTAKSRLHRALKSLRLAIESREETVR